MVLKCSSCCFPYPAAGCLAGIISAGPKNRLMLGLVLNPGKSEALLCLRDPSRASEDSLLPSLGACWLLHGISSGRGNGTGSLLCQIKQILLSPRSRVCEMPKPALDRSWPGSERCLCALVCHVLVGLSVSLTPRPHRACFWWGVPIVLTLRIPLDFVFS